jgi:hypothetical protein
MKNQQYYIVGTICILSKKVIYPQCGGITLDSDIVEFSVDNFNLV